jgi:hypothetical protein
MALHKETVTERNKRYVPKFEGLLPGERSWIASVAVGHPARNGGETELLKKIGWKIMQVWETRRAAPGRDK